MNSQINQYFDQLKQTLDTISREEIEQFINILITARNNNKHIFVMGNGGSASTASHMVCDLNKGASYQKDKRFKVICLNDSMSTLSAYGNDVSFDKIFVEQLANFVKEGDVVIAISGSGNSKNILEAIEYANQQKAITVGWTGYTEGKLQTLAQNCVKANINDMQIAEDIHMILNHLCLKLICENFS
ncbi:MAG: D-sedoheptulose-7-phosphate isomerase [Brevinema sp.]